MKGNSHCTKCRREGLGQIRTGCKIIFKKSVPDFQRFINIAQGSAAELRTQVYISREVNIFSDLDAKELIQELKTISKMLQSLHGSLKKL